MRAMFLAFAVTILIGVGADQALHRIGYSSMDRNASSDVRLD